LAGKQLDVPDTIIIGVVVTIAAGNFFTMAALISTIGALAETIRAEFLINDERANKQLETYSITV
jgi:hypothetical protein